MNSKAKMYYRDYLQDYLVIEVAKALEYTIPTWIHSSEEDNLPYWNYKPTFMGIITLSFDKGISYYQMIDWPKGENRE